MEKKKKKKKKIERMIVIIDLGCGQIGTEGIIILSMHVLVCTLVHE